MNELVARVLHRWNPEPRVNRLPLDVRAADSRLNLLLVCRRWHDIIVASPQLWEDLDVRMPLDVAQLVIERSRSHPISINWPSDISNNQEIESSEFLDLAIDNSTRIRRAIIYASPSSYLDVPNLRRLLEAPTPLLEDLTADCELEDSTSDGDGTLNEFVLSEGSFLKHLHLYDIATPLDSPRLSNLITINLGGSAVPQSPQPLLLLLSNSQRLEELHVWDLRSSTGDIESLPSTSVTLPRLTKITLGNTPSIYNIAVLASIHTPLCSHVSVKDRWVENERSSELVEALDALTWCRGSNLATTLTWGNGSRPVPDWLVVAVEGDRITVKAPETELQLSRDDISRILARLGAVFSQLPLAINLKIKLERSIDLLPWSERLDTLNVGKKEAIRRIIQQLSQRHVNPRNGEMDWICPMLLEISMWYDWGEKEDTPLDGEVLLSLVRQRWSGEDGLAAATQPTSFGFLCKRALCPNLWSLNDQIKQMVPSFRFID
ncbi:hypothetical protein FRC04_011423 [Tulasnella sp. 424]|nr:hypothetical protein FRC04_011423 [Tulasnella sp. 424]KAG8971945.1 hypothetical protein FRC05_010480 [Tulasnella sp. 425]